MTRTAPPRPRERLDLLGDLRREAPTSVDVLMRTPEEVRYWLGTPNHIINEAFRTGTVLYRAPNGEHFHPTTTRPMEMAQEFMKKAENDLFASRTLLEAEGGPTDAPAFHAQQAAEKGLKAILTLHEIDAPYTHKLEQLLDLVPEASAQRAQLELLGDRLEEISKYGVQTRYPGQVEEPSRAEARRALRVAEEAMRAARAQVEGK